MQIEIRPTRTIIHAQDGEDAVFELTVEQCDPDQSAEQWSLYERHTDGSLMSLCDCPDEATAMRIRDALMRAAPEPAGPIHCPLCAAERGVAIPAACPHLRPSLTIPDHTLEPIDSRPPGEGDGDDHDGRLTGVVDINGCRMHVEAIPVEIDADGAQVGTDETSRSRHEALCDEFGVSGFATTTIRGEEYVLVITPFQP
jgi:hypothetical protein